MTTLEQARAACKELTGAFNWEAKFPGISPTKVLVSPDADEGYVLAVYATAQPGEREIKALPQDFNGVKLIYTAFKNPYNLRFEGEDLDI